MTSVAIVAKAGVSLLSEEIAERVVIEQFLGLDDLCLPEIRRLCWCLVGRRRSMALPAQGTGALDLTVEPQLVHDFPEFFGAGVGHERAQVQHFVAAIGLHAIEDELGDSTQRMHGDSHESTGDANPV